MMRWISCQIMCVASVNKLVPSDGIGIGFGAVSDSY